MPISTPEPGQATTRWISKASRWALRRPILSALSGVLLFFWLVPVVPWRPTCGVYSSAYERYLEGPLDPDFRAAVADELRGQAHVLWWGDRPLMRFWPTADGWFLENGTAFSSAQFHAVGRLTDPGLSGTWIGRELNGRVYAVPARLERFRRPDGSLPDDTDCAFMEALALAPAAP
jgi:hypothetical protein